MEVQLGSSFQAENFGQWSDPVVLGSSGRDAKVFATGSPLTTGLWTLYPQPTKTATATVSLQAWAITAPFAGDVTTSTGNPWSGTSGTPLTLGPGQAGEIRVTITPHRQSSGMVSVETYDSTHVLASVVARLPYSFKVSDT